MIKYGDNLEVMKTIDDESVNLILTSPPYAMQRKMTYGGIDPNEYIEWFIPRSEQMIRVLKTSGSMIINIKECVKNGVRHTYVLRLILALIEQGWLWIDEYIWHKKNPMPIKPIRRLKDGWERCLHFTKSLDFIFRPNEVKQPPTNGSLKRASYFSDGFVSESKSGSGYVFRRTKETNAPTAVYPSNVLHIATSVEHTGHSAVFPSKLPEFFIALMTDLGHVVLDPFCGSGTTGIASAQLGREFIGIDLDESACAISEKRIRDFFTQSQTLTIPV